MLTITATATEQPEVKVGRLVWHEWRRATAEGGDVVVVERTKPEDGQKAVFFWNVNGVVLDGGKVAMERMTWLEEWLPEAVRGWAIMAWIKLNLLVIFAHLDNFPVFIDVPGSLGRNGPTLAWFDWVASHVILSIALCAGYVLGMKPVQRRFTPSDVYEDWWSSKSSMQTKRR